MGRPRAKSGEPSLLTSPVARADKGPVTERPLSAATSVKLESRLFWKSRAFSFEIVEEIHVSTVVEVGGCYGQGAGEPSQARLLGEVEVGAVAVVSQEESGDEDVEIAVVVEVDESQRRGPRREERAARPSGRRP